MKVFLLKSLIALSSISLALLLVINTAIAETISDRSEVNILQFQTPRVSLNIISPLLSSIDTHNNVLAKHLGCSCAICSEKTGSIEL